MDVREDARGLAHVPGAPVIERAALQEPHHDDAPAGRLRAVVHPVWLGRAPARQKDPERAELVARGAFQLDLARAADAQHEALAGRRMREDEIHVVLAGGKDPRVDRGRCGDPQRLAQVSSAGEVALDGGEVDGRGRDPLLALAHRRFLMVRHARPPYFLGFSK